MTVHQLPNRFWEKVDVRGADECWEWQGYRDPNGYGRFNLQSVLVGPELAHRLVLGLRKGDNGLCLHHCDNPPCVNPSHLYIGTYVDNVRDMFVRGRSNFTGRPGESNPSARSTEDHVFAARWLKLTSPDMTTRQIARRVRGTNSAGSWVSHVVRRKTWGHLDDPDTSSPADQARAISLGLSL